MKKKIVALVIVLALVCGLLAGCSTQSTDAGSSSAVQTDDSTVVDTPAEFPLSEPYTVEAFAFANTGEELGNTLTMIEMEKKTNIHWNFTNVSEAEREEKMNLSFNSGDYYDVYIKSGISAIDAYKYGQQGIIIPLNDLIDKYMPNLKAVLDEQGTWAAVTSGDGNIYSLPQLDGPSLAAPSVFVNQKWLDAVGMKVPTTQDEFLEVLRAFASEDPNGNGEKDEYGIYCPAAAVNYTMPLFGIAMDYGTMSMYQDGKMIYVPTSEEYKNFLSFWKQAYEEGLINSDCYTASWDDLNAIGATGDTLGMIPTWGVYQHVGTERDEDYVPVMPFGGKHTIPAGNGVGYGGLVITDKCEHPELICQWADYFYSEEGAILARMGVEGESFTMDSDGKYHWKTDGDWGADITTIRNTATMYGWYPAPLTKCILFDEGQANEEELFLYGLRQQMLEYKADAFPTLSWTEDELNTRADIITAINAYVDEYQAQVVTGQIDLDTTWDSYVENLKAMGLEQMTAIDQAAYDRWLSEQA